MPPRKKKAPKRVVKQKQKQRQSVVVTINQQRKTVQRRQNTPKPTPVPSVSPIFQFPQQYDNTSSIISAIKSVQSPSSSIINDVARVDRAEEQAEPLRTREQRAAFLDTVAQHGGLSVEESRPPEPVPTSIPAIYIVKAPLERLNVPPSPEEPYPFVQVPSPNIRELLTTLPGAAGRRARSLKRSEVRYESEEDPYISEGREFSQISENPFIGIQEAGTEPALESAFEPAPEIRKRVLTRKLYPVGGTPLGVEPAGSSYLRGRISDHNREVGRGSAQYVPLSEKVGGRRRQKTPGQLQEELADKGLYYLLPDFSESL
jgi:hypothetical protein